MYKVNVDYKKMYYGFPIYFLSFYGENGVPNFSTMSSSFTLRDTLVLGMATNSYATEIIKKSKEFVLNLPDRTMMEQIEIGGFTSGREYNKFDFSGLTPVKSEKINAPIIDEAPIAIECIAQEIFPSAESPEITFIIAKIVGRLISKDLLDDKDFLNSSAVDPVIYIGDHKMRYYRYLDKSKSDRLGTYFSKIDSKK